MRKAILLSAAVGVTAGLLLLPVSAAGQAEPPPTTTTPLVPPEPPEAPAPDPCLVRTQAQHENRAKEVIDRAFPIRRWEAGAILPGRRTKVHSKPDRFGKRERRIVDEKVGCLITEKDRKDVRQFKRRKNAKYREAAKWYDSWCAPPGRQDPAGGGCWGKSAALVACEAGTSQPGRHSPAWRAANSSSSASGPYQGLTGTWPIPFPVLTWADAQQHHRVFGVGGIGHGTSWVCPGG